MSIVDVEGYKKGVTVSIDVIEADSDGDNVWMFISWDDATLLRDMLSREVAVHLNSEETEMRRRMMNLMRHAGVMEQLFRMDEEGVVDLDTLGTDTGPCLDYMTKKALMGKGIMAETSAEDGTRYYLTEKGRRVAALLEELTDVVG